MRQHEAEALCALLTAHGLRGCGVHRLFPEAVHTERALHYVSWQVCGTVHTLRSSREAAEFLRGAWGEAVAP